MSDRKKIFIVGFNVVMGLVACTFISLYINSWRQETQVREYVYQDILRNPSLMAELKLSDGLVRKIGEEIIQNSDRDLRIRAVEVCAFSRNPKARAYLKHASIFDDDPSVRIRALTRLNEVNHDSLLQLLRQTTSFSPFDVLLISNPTLMFEFPSQIKKLCLSHDVSRKNIIKLFPSLSD